MGHMDKKHRRRVDHLEKELALLEATPPPTKANPRLKVQHRIKRIREVELPKARRNKG